MPLRETTGGDWEKLKRDAIARCKRPGSAAVGHSERCECLALLPIASQMEATGFDALSLFDRSLADIEVADRTHLDPYVRDAATASPGARGVFVWGAGSGGGKTTLATLLCARLVQWVFHQTRTIARLTECRYMGMYEFSDLARRGRHAFLDRIGEGENARTVDAWSVEVMVVDDLGREPGSPDAVRRAREALEAMLRHRKSLARPTILAGSLRPADLIEVLGPQMASLIRETMVPVEVVGEDRREQAPGW